MAPPSGLSRSAFLILLALSDRPRHGLGIADEIEDGIDGSRLGPGTLYATLEKLLGEGLIRETQRAPDPSDDDPRRRYYAISARGERALRAETIRLRSLVQAAVAKRVLEGA